MWETIYQIRQYEEAYSVCPWRSHVSLWSILLSSNTGLLKNMMNLSQVSLWSLWKKSIHKVILKHIFSLFMKVSSILVISFIIKLQEWVVYRGIISLNMKVSSFLVICEIKKLQHRRVFRGIFSLNMVSSILVNNVINNLR